MLFKEKVIVFNRAIHSLFASLFFLLLSRNKLCQKENSIHPEPEKNRDIGIRS